MEEIYEEIKEAIKGLESYKNRYRTMKTQDVIDMLKRLNENVKLTIPVVVVPKGTLCECKEYFDLEKNEDYKTVCSTCKKPLLA